MLKSDLTCGQNVGNRTKRQTTETTATILGQAYKVQKVWGPNPVDRGVKNKPDHVLTGPIDKIVPGKVKRKGAISPLHPGGLAG